MNATTMSDAALDAAVRAWLAYPLSGNGDMAWLIDSSLLWRRRQYRDQMRAAVDAYLAAANRESGGGG